MMLNLISELFLIQKKLNILIITLKQVFIQGMLIITNHGSFRNIIIIQDYKLIKRKILHLNFQIFRLICYCFVMLINMILNLIYLGSKKYIQI